MLICAFPCFSGDCKKLHELLHWIKQLGSCAPNKAVIVADYGTPFSEVQEAKKIAGESFSEVFLVSTKESVNGWIAGANSLFWTALEFAEKVNTPILFCEPDSVPLKTGWLHSLDAEFDDKKAKYLGAFYDCDAPNLPKRLMSGVGIYFSGAAKELVRVPQSPRSFDCDYAEILVKEGSDTKLIYNLWGEPNNPPRFADKGIPGTAVFSIDQIPKEAVLYHRQKDGSLILQLRKKMRIKDPNKLNGFVVVLPFFQKDSRLALENMKWQQELGGSKKYDCLLAYESNVEAALAAQILAVTKATYKTVFVLKYPPARIPGWPSGPNWGFQHVANYMETMGRSWLFMEPDMFALKTEWLDILQDGYAHCGKACMGHVVKDFGHLQGTSIYPADLPSRFPKMMAATSVAFDTVSKDEVLKDCHDSGDLTAHIWGMNGDSPHHFVGHPIHFSTVDQVRKWVPAGAVTLHRCKDKSIADRLREMKS